MGPRICICNELPSDTEAAGRWTIYTEVEPTDSLERASQGFKGLSNQTLFARTLSDAIEKCRCGCSGSDSITSSSDKKSSNINNRNSKDCKNEITTNK